MKLLDLLLGAWAILPEQLTEIQAIYACHLRGEKIDIAALEARLGRPLASEQQQYQLREGGVAVLSLEGVMAPKANLFMQVSGGVSTQMAGKQVESAAVDPRVKAMILAIDSPGGSIFGTPELAATVRAFAEQKPIVTVSEATLASAAYWVASAANAIYISGPTVQAGSIGVVATHNYDPRNAKGSTTEITAGKYKRIASNTAPLSADGRAYLQSQVDHLYRVFVETVADNRRASTQDVLAHMADGRIFIGNQAIDAGLVDGISTVDAMAEQLASNPAKYASRVKAKFHLPPQPAGEQTEANQTPEPVPLKTSTPTMKDPKMDRATLEQQHPALFAQLQAEFSAQATSAANALQSAAIASAANDGAARERQRISDVRAQCLPGHQALIEQLAFDGKTTGPEAAMAVLAAERLSLAGAAAAHAADAPKPAPHASAPSDTTPSAKTLAANALAAHKTLQGA